MPEFQTNKTKLNQFRVVDTPTVDTLESGQIRAKVDRFAFTANNITYAVLGDRLRYWQFFQPHGDNASDWGIIPVWGFADVMESNSTEIPVGDRIFGYFLPAEELIMNPIKVSNGGFIEGAAHRAELPPSYNSYTRVNADPNYSRANDDARMLLYVLHLTAFCLHDLLISNNWYGAEQVLVISASSKTSTGLGYMLKDDPDSPKVIGLTSERNLDLVKEIGIYDDAISYQQVENIDASKPTVIIDMSANGELLGRLHSHLADNMKFCSNVGLTHWDEATMGPGFIAERSAQFFAPGHIQQRIKEWGNEEFQAKTYAAVSQSMKQSEAWLKMTELDGLNGLQAVYEDMVNGQVAADKGLIVVM